MLVNILYLIEVIHLLIRRIITGRYRNSLINYDPWCILQVKSTSTDINIFLSKDYGRYQHLSSTCSIIVFDWHSLNACKNVHSIIVDILFHHWASCFLLFTNSSMYVKNKNDISQKLVVIISNCKLVGTIF